MASSIKTTRYFAYRTLAILIVMNCLVTMESPINLLIPHAATTSKASIRLTASAFSIGRFGWPGLEWREIIDWWTSGYSRGVVIGRNYIPPCKLCDMPRMFRVDK